MKPVTPVTLVVGAAAALREAAIAAAMTTMVSSTASVIDPNSTSVISIVVLLEGLAGGHEQLANAAAALIGRAKIETIRIAPGCPCCTGNLTLRVTLNRILRHPPQALYIGVANSPHLAAFRQFLTQAPYDQLLRLNQDLLV